MTSRAPHINGIDNVSWWRIVAYGLVVAIITSPICYLVFK